MAAAFSSATLALGTVACNWLGFTKLVAKAELFQSTIDEGTNPLPFTVRVKLPLCSTTKGGLTLVIIGTGLFTDSVTVPLMVAKAVSLTVSVWDPAVIRIKPFVKVWEP